MCLKTLVIILLCGFLTIVFKWLEGVGSFILNVGTRFIVAVENDLSDLGKEVVCSSSFEGDSGDDVIARSIRICEDLRSVRWLHTMRGMYVT